MKLLIADDEALTRDGLIHSIDWEALGITEIFQADDGQNGFLLAQKNVPDIILTDVRMPRMNGIEMSEKIQQLNPNCPIIFMSGYSDKEYLKAAIKLRAVRYVEKPIDAQEIIEAIREASLFVAEKKRQFQTKELFQKEADSRLALQLTKPDFSAEILAEYPKTKELSLSDSTYFSTLIIKFNKYLSDFVEADLSDLLQQLDTLIRKRNLHQIHTLKNEEFLILHIYGNDRPSTYLLEHLCKDIRLLLAPYQQFFVVAGKTVMGPKKVYTSYHSAVILLQNAFFHPYGSILFSDTEEIQRPEPDIHAIPEQFLALLSDKETAAAHLLTENLYQQLLYNKTMLVNQAKDIYYKLLMHINTVIYQLKLSATPELQTSESPMELVTRCNNLVELSSLLSERLTAFEQLLNSSPSENSTIFLIRDYIGKHFSDDCLSIKDISDHVHLSSSYICTLFKTETGQTLNQYITEYRMEKAKQLLADPRNKISEISAKVGYADGNYFSKSFKKAVGLSPSEYRERELS